MQLERWVLAETSAYLTAAIGRPPPYRAAVSLHNRTGGNPFFLEELLRDMSRDDLEELCERPLPWSLAEALRRQVEDLEPTHQRLVEAAAVLGNRVPFDLLAVGLRRCPRASSSTRCGSWSGAGSWPRPARTSSRSATRWSARRSASACSVASAAGCTRRRWTRCWPPATPTGRC